ncbi:hypothetical protein JCM16303_001794 [Sporobolomyces ruberrimus]
MFRPAFRSILRQAAPAQRRTIANEASASAGAETEFIKSRKAVADHAAHSSELWRKITYYVAFPAVIVGLLNAKSMADEHEHHLEHIKHENGGELPPRIKYPYFNKRDKDMPWPSNKTLFWNEKVQVPLE